MSANTKITRTQSEQLADFMGWQYNDTIGETFYGTGMFTLAGHLAVVGVVLTGLTPEAAVDSLYDLSDEGVYGEASDTDVRERVFAAATIMREVA